MRFSLIGCSVVAMMMYVFGLSGCTGKTVKPEPEASTEAPPVAEAVVDQSVPSAYEADNNVITGDSDSDRSMGLSSVHFPYDSFEFSESERVLLNQNAQFLKMHSNLKIQIEGHCDERGGIQYNIALGEKRAKAVQRYLVNQGVDSERMTIISFGKEKPIDLGSTDEAYAKNRRANFVITSR